MQNADRLVFLDNLRTFLVFLVIVIHAGAVYESSGIFGLFWIVDDPSTSDLPGLVNLVLDIFVMATIFFISGYVTPGSVDRHGTKRYLVARMRRILIPWALAAATLIPLYKVVFLYSRGMPQEHWTSYFHFTNGFVSMNWLWYLPVLFVFDCLYVVLRHAGVSLGGLRVRNAVGIVLVVGFAYSWTMSLTESTGWTKTALIDFQNERLLIYFLYFALGALCYRQRAFDGAPSRWGFAIASATAWVPVVLYGALVINLLLDTGSYVVSARGDVVMLWIAFHLALGSLVFLSLDIARRWFDRPRPLGKLLAPHAYGVYVVHMAVLAGPAVLLLNTAIPAILKYSLLVVVTYTGSVVVSLLLRRFASRLPARPTPRMATASPDHGA
ncbi:MAG: acyltransferase family protein [Acidobacteria bacterium]|nr:acyltransferase family protein [Acidobacteriota bacterium]